MGRALRAAGNLVFPARYHEEGVDALTRVRPDIVLVEAIHHEAVASPTFQQLARELGARVMFFSRVDGSGDQATLRTDSTLPFPVIEFTGDGRALVALVDEIRRGAAA